MTMRCEPCAVEWNGITSHLCWVCGERGKAGSHTSPYWGQPSICDPLNNWGDPFIERRTT